MFRTTTRFALALIGLTVACAALASDKYPSPAPKTIDDKLCIVVYDTDYPLVQDNGDGTVTYLVKGGYNYDDAWSFKTIDVTVNYIKGGVVKTPAGGSVTIKTEGKTTGAGAGVLKVAFSKVAPPASDESVQIVAKITISKAGQTDKERPTTSSPKKINCAVDYSDDSWLIVTPE